MNSFSESSCGPTALRPEWGEKLNDAQRAAVEHMEGPLLVIAGAGSGKTRTLTHRVARLVAAGVPPAAVLLLTFTRKASQEMLQRAARLLDNRCERVSGGTFHSFANLKLRQHAAHLGLSPDFAILDRTDAEDLIGLIRKEADGSSSGHRLPRKNTLADIFSRAVNKVQPLEEVVCDDYPHFSDQMETLLSMFAEYSRRKREHHFLDYDDLLVYFQRLLQDFPEVRRRISSAYQYIMVDEYQDTNKIQAQILYLLTDATQNIMVVGDDSQSIYAFRGANFRNIMEFPSLFPGARIIGLEENYRSTQPILDLTNIVIERAREKYSKHLFTRTRGGATPQMIETEDENTQSRFVVERVADLRSQGICLRRIAVLFRAGFHSFDLEIELAREKIPFIKVGGFKFTESAHIKDVLAHLRVLANPYDRISWYRILQLVEKVGPRNAQRIYESIVQANAGLAGLYSLKAKNPEIDRLKTLYRAIDAAPMPVAEMGTAVVQYYLPILRQSFDDHPKRTKDLEQLLGIMERYGRLEPFLTDMALEPPNISVEDRLYTNSEEEDRLVLSTIHSAKGLEWHSVFIIWALDGRFPSLYALSREEEMEEELRLMYVAATRAQEVLFFTYPRQVYDRSLGIVLNRPSRFIDMIPDEILEKRSIGFSGRSQVRW
ncbi:MAG: ATP-dependent helicase [Hyphomicrobiales bacterium]